MKRDVRDFAHIETCFSSKRMMQDSKSWRASILRPRISRIFSKNLKIWMLKSRPRATSIKSLRKSRAKQGPWIRDFSFIRI